MTASFAGTVLFGDVVDLRSDPDSTAWLRSLCGELEAAYPREQRLASFAFTQGDELQGLLAPDADPFRAVLLAALRPDARELRWAIVAGDVDPGSGPAIERTGRAFFVARESIARARAHRDGLVAHDRRPRGGRAPRRPGAAAGRAARGPDAAPARGRAPDPHRRAAPVGGRRPPRREPGDRVRHRRPGAGPPPRGAGPDPGRDLRRGGPRGRARRARATTPRPATTRRATTRPTPATMRRRRRSAAPASRQASAP